MTLVLGVDGGNSKTTALLMRQDGCCLGHITTEGSNHENIGFPAAGAVLERAAGDALAAAGITPPIDAAFWGLAGVDIASDARRLSDIVERTNVARNNIVKNDVFAAMGAGLSCEWGVGIISGAGFSACGIAPNGQTLQFPSLGAATGDWGGGADIGLETLRLAHRSFDGRGEKTALESHVPAALGMPSLSDLPQWMRSDRFDWTAVRDRLPPLLFQLAEDGDEVARQLVIRVATEVAVTAVAILRRLDLLDAEVEIVLGGSIFGATGPLLLESIATALYRDAPQACLVRPEFPPVVGAAFQALRHEGVEITEDVRTRVRKSLPAEMANLNSTPKEAG